MPRTSRARVQVYTTQYDQNYEELKKLGMQCYGQIKTLTIRPFGPPSEWVSVDRPWCRCMRAQLSHV